MNSDFCVAVHALVYLNRRGCVLSSEELARNICTNPARVRKVLARMKKDGLVETKEGSSGGGYRFAKGAGEVSLAQVARALEVRFVSTSWHSGSQEVKCLVATGMAQVMEPFLMTWTAGAWPGWRRSQWNRWTGSSPADPAPAADDPPQRTVRMEVFYGV